jgi:DNA polymerase III alpha subunit/intein/homing endonuclease
LQLSFNCPYSIEEYKRLLLVENYHKHTSFSNTSTPDSPVIMDDYVKREQELGAKCLFGGEHGNQGNFAENYFLAKKNNLKYVHSAEAYWVKNRHEKDRTNCHICIIALNNRARQELNYILSIANEDGYYGKPRIDLELILSLNPEDFIITSACLQGWKYDDADEIWLKIANHFGTNFFLEVQNHNTEKQKELNRNILSLAKEYDLQIICGLDSHYISVEKDEERRNEYLKYKKMNYPEEDGWYLDYPDGKTIYKRFKEQGVLSDEEILYSMMNTQVFNVKCEEIVIDNTFKIPILYKDKTFDERVQILKSHLNKAYKKEKLKSKEKIEGIKWETEQIVDSKVMDYFLTNEAIISDAINNEGGILTTTSRGSSASFIINKLLGFTTLDRFNSEIPIYPERFLTKERISAGQMPDIDFNVSSQEPFVRAAKKIVGENGCYPLMAVEKMSEKSAWQLYASVSGVAPIIANQISKYLDSYNETIKHLETEEEKKDIKVEDYIPKEYISIYNKSKEYQSIIVNLKVHACFTGESLVLTKNGYKKIEDIKIGDYVLTHNNKYQQVAKTFCLQTDELIELKITGETIKVTPNHPFYVRTRIGSYPKTYSQPYWKRAKDLNKEDWIASPINQESEIPVMVDVNKTHKGKVLDLSDKDSWWLIGRYMGDGWTESPRKEIHKIVICCSKNNNEYQEIISRIPNHIHYYIEEAETVYKIVIHNKSFFEYLQQFGKYAYGKKITQDILNLPIDLLEEFIKGYLSADGCKYGTEITFNTVSQELAYGLQQCIHKVYKTPCTIRISNQERTEIIQGRTVQCKKKFVGRFSLKNVKYKVNEFDSGYAWFKLKEKKVIQEKAEVYNLSVINDNSYTVYNLAVHNCGFLLFDGDLRREFGLISAISQTTKKRTLCVAVEGKYLDDLGYVKNDFLIVDSVGVANECFQSIGQKVPTTEELKTLISKDNKTWQIYEYGITQCVNQVEQEKTKQKIVKYKPQTVSELAAFIAGIRPGFSSLLPTFLDRQYYSTGEDKIDEVLKDSYHYMIYQESIMKVLSFLQMPMASTYDVVKSISKKKLKGEKKEKLKNELKQSWMNIFGNTKNFEKIWQVINDAASYSFNCLSENTIIYSPNHKKSVKLLTIGDMYRICHDYQYAKETRHLALHKKYKYNGYGKTLSLFQDGKLHYNDILEIYDAGIQDTYTVTTKTGKTIDCTMEHKFPTPKGKLPLKELKIGDKFYVKPDFIGICFDGIPVYEDEIISIEYKTKEQVYNVSMADPAHNFVVNDGIVTSNSPHALSMAFDSLYLAYFKSHYTSKFYETTINHYFAKGNKDKINKLTLEAEEFYYYENKIPKFGKNYDTAIVEDDTKYIYPILSSIKSMQNIANDILYQISKKNPDDFLELLYMTEQIKVNGKKINKTSMEILIKLGFFDKFGDVNYLLEYYSIFQKYFGKTQVKKQDFGYSLSNNIIKKETEKTIFIYDSCMMIDEIMQQINIKDCTLYQKSYYQLKSLGYTDIHINNAGRDVYMVMGIEKNKYGTPFAQLYKPKNGKSQLIKLDKKWYSKYPIEGGEVLRCEFEHKNKSRKDEKGNWYKIDEKEWILKRYSILTKLEE